MPHGGTQAGRYDPKPFVWHRPATEIIAKVDDLAGEGGAQVGDVPVNVWVGEDGMLRRLTVEIERDMTVTTNSPGGPPLPSDAAGSLTSLAYEAFDYGEPVEIEIPASEDIIDAPEREDAGA